MRHEPDRLQIQRPGRPAPGSGLVTGAKSLDVTIFGIILLAGVAMGLIFPCKYGPDHGFRHAAGYYDEADFRGTLLFNTAKFSRIAVRISFPALRCWLVNMIANRESGAMIRKTQSKATSESGSTDMLLRQFVGYNMKCAYLHIQSNMTEVLAPLGLRIGTFSALAVVLSSPGISQSRLSRMLDMKRSRVVLVVDELEHAGLVQRTPVPHDRRAHALRATPAGKRLWKRAERVVSEQEALLFAGLDADQFRGLQDLLIRAARCAAHYRQETNG